MAPARVVDRALTNAEWRGECRVSLYSRGSHGYAQVGWADSGRTHTVLCHRVVWEAVHGPIPDGMTIDHLCRNRPCINVAHLRLLSNVDNARDNGMRRRTHCPAGHEYNPSNTYINPRGHRFCRACAKQRTI